MSFKFFRGKSTNITELSSLQLASLRITGNVHTNNQYCIQFDDEDPFVLLNSDDSLTFSVLPTEGGSIEFNHNGRRFKIFAREII